MPQWASPCVASVPLTPTPTPTVQIVKKLDFIAMKEEQAKQAQHAWLVKAASANATSTFSASKELQSQALNEALETIADPSKAKTDDVVGKLFTSYFNSAK